MGELADDIINGFSCSWCGLYFTDEHGFPVVCRKCFNDWKLNNKKGRKQFTEITGLQVAINEEL